MQILLPIAVATCLALSPAPRSASELDALERGRECTRLFYEGAVDALWPRLGAELQQAFGEAVNVKAFRQQVDDQLGAEVEVLREDVIVAQQPYTTYRRTARFAKYEEPILVLWSFDGEGIVRGFQVTPEVVRPAPSKYLEYRTQTELTLPFAPGDAWFVFWGGREVEQNYHAAYADQRFAYDLLALVDGKTHTGDGKKNEDYACFDRAIVAPGAGVVVSVATDVPDNVPGQMNAAAPLGNHVILDHGNGEFSVLAHFKQGSVVVEPGQRVAAGDALGRSGNSGNSSEPHLHYHLQDAAEFQKGAQGMPAFFLSYEADGVLVERGEPLKGQTLRAVARAPATPR